MVSLTRICHYSLNFFLPRIGQSNTEEAAKDIGAFIAIFFEHFIKFKGRAFHMAGESYGVSDVGAIFLILLTQRCLLGSCRSYIRVLHIRPERTTGRSRPHSD